MLISRGGTIEKKEVHETAFLLEKNDSAQKQSEIIQNQKGPVLLNWEGGRGRREGEGEGVLAPHYLKMQRSPLMFLFCLSQNGYGPNRLSQSHYIYIYIYIYLFIYLFIFIYLYIYIRQPL